MFSKNTRDAHVSPRSGRAVAAYGGLLTRLGMRAPTRGSDQMASIWTLRSHRPRSQPNARGIRVIILPLKYRLRLSIVLPRARQRERVKRGRSAKNWSKDDYAVGSPRKPSIALVPWTRASCGVSRGVSWKIQSRGKITKRQRPLVTNHGYCLWLSGQKPCHMCQPTGSGPIPSRAPEGTTPPGPIRRFPKFINESPPPQCPRPLPVASGLFQDRLLSGPPNAASLLEAHNFRRIRSQTSLPCDR